MSETMKISIQLGDLTLHAELNGNSTSKAIYEALPFESAYNVWGDEIYFRIPVDSDEPVERDMLEVGELAFWPPGNAFCIFYGRTPASTDDYPRAASYIIPLGKIEGDATCLKPAQAEKIVIRRVDESKSS